MAASLMMRTGLRNAFLKSNPTQPLPRCFGSITILPSRTGEGNPSETASNSQSATSGLISFASARGVSFCPDLIFLLSAREIISFTFDPPTSTTRTLLLISTVSVSQREVLTSLLGPLTSTSPAQVHDQLLARLGPHIFLLPQ